jgi:hypothetical protein
MAKANLAIGTAGQRATLEFTPPPLANARALSPFNIWPSLEVPASTWTVFSKQLSMETLPWSSFTEDSDASALNRPLHSLNFNTPSSLSSVTRRLYCNILRSTDMTALHIAIQLGHADIVEVLFTRYSQLDRSSLEWYEPTSLQMAAYIRDIDMAAPILDGSSPDSPWVARARSQLLDPRAYNTTMKTYFGRIRPPMIMACLGMNA